MLKNHILLAFRHLKKEKGYTLSSIVGLALAFTACFFTFSFTVHEYTADAQFDDWQNTYLLRANDTIDSPIRFPFIPTSNAQYMMDHFPEVQVSVPVYQGREEMELTINGKKFMEDLWLYTEPEVLSLFIPEYFEVKNPFTAGTVLINETSAKRFFGANDPVGQMVATKEGNYLVAGTFKDFPSNSHLSANVLAVPLSPKTREDAQGLIYLKLQESVDINAFALKVDAESINMKRFMDIIRYTIVNVKSIYLTEEHETGMLKKANLELIRMLIIISSIILFISLFNIVNLTQVKTLFRGREIGIKKVLGITGKQVAGQFLIESSIVVLLSCLLAVSIIQISGQQVLSYLQMDGFSLGVGSAFMISLMLVVVVVLAVMQSLLFSKVLPRDVMAGKFRVGERRWLLKGLVSLQFLIACTLIGGAFVVDKQMKFIISKPLGFNVDNLWYIPMRSSTFDLQLMKSKVASIPEIRSSTISSALPFLGHGIVVDKTEKGVEYVPFVEIDKDYISTLQITYINQPEYFPDSGLIVNEQLMARDDIDVEKMLDHKIIAEVKDFHFSGLSSKISSLVLSVETPRVGYLAMRIDEGQESIAKEKLNVEWESLYPDREMEFISLYDGYLEKHKKASELATVLKALSLIAVFISCIGLASLTGFFVRKRFKEIAIRKVLGASVHQVIRQVNAGYIAWIMAATAVAMFIVYYYGKEYLDNFAYATTLDGWVIAGPVVLLLAISATIMVLQTWKTARANPVEALRTE
ncbi:MAG: FtsX-like permease family protein [Imperialibacter sp.]|uniref:ABC transporter permease n=1 Tax=Imperialibacter sp. TaxID=2038411 RepID=UPI0032ED478A